MRQKCANALIRTVKERFDAEAKVNILNKLAVSACYTNIIEKSFNILRQKIKTRKTETFQQHLSLIFKFLSF